MNINKFIVKLIEMMSEFPQIINWSFDGQEMQIFDIQKFQNEVYPKYFTTKNYKSFVRQLNMYLFRRISKGKNSASFKHQEFKKGNEAYFQNIRRRRQQNKHRKVVLVQNTHNQTQEPTSLSALTMPDNELLTVIEQIKMVISQRGLSLVSHLQDLLLKAVLRAPLKSNQNFSAQTQPIINLIQSSSADQMKQMGSQSDQFYESSLFDSAEERGQNFRQ